MDKFDALNVKISLIVFDIDGTLTSFNKPISSEVSAIIRHIEDTGVKIALSSGKDLSYLKMMSEDLGIKRPITIAENGCVIADVANNKEIWLSERTNEIRDIINKIRNRFSDSLWEQPNKVEYSFFSNKSERKLELISYAKKVVSQYADKVHAYVGFGSIDVLPINIDKGVALMQVKKIYGIKKEEVAAVGNGENDIPMFKEAGLPLIVGKQISYADAMKFNTIIEVLDFLASKERKARTPKTSDT